MVTSTMEGLKYLATLTLVLALLPWQPVNTHPDLEGVDLPAGRRRRSPDDGTPSEGDFTVLGGPAEGTGNLYIFHSGGWGAVCDDGWSLGAAHIACRSMGFPFALQYTVESHFGYAVHDIVLDNVQCHGHEESLLDCQHPPLGYHDCGIQEVAGVFCAPRMVGLADPTRRSTTSAGPITTTTPETPTTTTTAAPITTTPLLTTTPSSRRAGGGAATQSSAAEEMAGIQANGGRERPRKKRPTSSPNVDGGNTEPAPSGPHHTHNPGPYRIRIVGGRNADEGRVEVKIGGSWGAICSDRWTLLEATVACRQAGKGFARTAIATNYFGGDDLDKLVGGLECDGEESLLSDCIHEQLGDVICPQANQVAGAVCTMNLPDLVPNATLLQQSTYLQDQPMFYLQCAMEENCASSSAYRIKETTRDWHIHRRRLLRFSSSTWNFGTADFRPFANKQDWDWHLCHMHYHSMEVFAHYDLLDEHHNRVAEGHKASFCLEDVHCLPGKEKKYACKGYGDQGISVGCADDYLHDIDCQWIDVTDVKPGNYQFRMLINPAHLVAELSYSNNAATCDLYYNGYTVSVTNCQLGHS